MRLPFLALALALGLALTACAAEFVPLPDAGPCSSACGAGTVCVGGACVAVDAGAPGDAGALDVAAEDHPAPVDVPVAADVGVMDAGVDALDVADVLVDVDPRQSEVCRGITALCDGRTVNVQTGERDGGMGRTYHCGGCGNVCEPGSFCVNCVCER